MKPDAGPAMTLELADIGMAAARRVRKHVAQMPAETKQSIFGAEVGGKAQCKNAAGAFVLAGGIMNRGAVEAIVKSGRLIVIVLGNPGQRIFEVESLGMKIGEQLRQCHGSVSGVVRLFRGFRRPRQVQLDDICSIGLAGLCHKMRA